MVDPSDSGFKEGQRVVSNGHHAELVDVSKSVLPIPDGVDDESATLQSLGRSFTKRVRLAEPTIGESVAVIGLGLIGLLTVHS